MISRRRQVKRWRFQKKIARFSVKRLKFAFIFLRVIKLSYRGGSDWTLFMEYSFTSCYICTMRIFLFFIGWFCQSSIFFALFTAHSCLFNFLFDHISYLGSLWWLVRMNLFFNYEVVSFLSDLSILSIGWIIWKWHSFVFCGKRSGKLKMTLVCMNIEYWFLRFWRDWILTMLHQF